MTNKKLSPQLYFLLNLAKIQAVLGRKFDASLNGLGLSEFIILYHLSLARDNKLRRIDLAEKVGLTASGVTRLLLPMEKIGLVKRVADETDARVSFVALANGGKTKLDEGIERAEELCEDLLPTPSIKKLEELSQTLANLL